MIKFSGSNWINPYKEEQAFLISPSVTEYEGRDFELLLPSSLWLTNSAGSINNISIDINDGNGFRVITPGIPLAVNYQDTGRKEWTYRVTLTNNAQLYAHSSVNIKFTVSENINTSQLLFTASNAIDVIPITATESYNYGYSSGYMSIRYANSDGVLRKPLIVAEGFDVGHILSPEKQFGENNINNSFIDYLNNPQGSYALRQLLLDNAQYDIIYVDWKNGTDYL